MGWDHSQSLVCPKLFNGNEWIDAANNQSVRNEYDTLAFFTAQTDCMFHSLLIRNRSLWRKKDKNQVVQATRLAMTLEPGYADGKPLRLLPTQGIDTKFFERHTQLVTALLDVRYDGEVSKIGLETFLGALTNSDHWLLVMDLDNTLLPFQKQRVRSSELRTIGLPCDRLLIVENESCQHQIPLLPHTIAVLGTGFDLGWTDGHWLQHKQVGYWGDIDTWGLHLLATARNKIKHLDALLMTNDIYNRYVSMAVPEPVTAGSQIPNGLNENEQLLYSRLLKTLNGRLEQEFLPEPVIRDAILAWGKRQFVTIRDLYHQ